MKVFIYCRYPELGKVKTRIAKDCGDAGALAVYEKLLKKVFNNIKESGYPFEVHYTGGRKLEVDYWLQNLEAKPQSQGNLGEKLKNSVSNWFESNQEPIAIIGSDQPNIDKKTLEETEFKLRTNDVILGPAEDGGYYLIAMNAPYLNLFDDIAWGTESVLSQTIDKLTKLSLTYDLLPVKNDVDYLDDVPEEWKSELMLHENCN